MREIIERKLREIETARGVRILLAVESGSRAWGFASPDSDYDVRFVYLQSPAAYLRLDKTRDVIEWELNAVLDINGWDLQKALRLLHGSNPTLFEWAGSPVVYRSTPEWEAVRLLAEGYFSPRAGMFHYLNLARREYTRHICGETARYKAYLYALRAVLCCRWIAHNQTPPPVAFADLARAELAQPVRPLAEELLERKSRTGESDRGPRLPELDRYLERQLAEWEAAAPAVPRQGGDWERLNETFLRLLGMGE